MGQTTSSEGTLYPSPGHERTAILESLRFLRKRVKKIGESESPLLVLVIRKHEARLKDLEDASQITKKRVLDAETPQPKRVCTEAHVIARKIEQEEEEATEEETRKTKPICIERTAMGQKRKCSDNDDELVKDPEAAFSEMEEREKLVKKVKISEEAKSMESQAVKDVSANSENDLENDIKVAFAELEQETCLAGEVKVNKEGISSASPALTTVRTPVSQKRVRDDFEDDTEGAFENAPIVTNEDERPIKKTKFNKEKEKLIDSNVLPQAKAPTPLKISEEENQNTSQITSPATGSSQKLVLKNTTSAGHKKARFVPRRVWNPFKVTKSIKSMSCKAGFLSNHYAILLPHKRQKVEGSLRELTAEIRLMIFKYYFQTPYGKWNGRSPALIRALRCDQVIYPEIMEEFYKSDQEYHLNQRNGWSFCSMSAHAIESIRTLRIEIKEYHPPPPKYRHRAWTQVPNPKKITKLYHQAINVERISIQSCIGGLTCGKVVPSVIRTFPDYLVNTKKLRSLDTDFRFVNAPRNHLTVMQSEVVPMVNKLLGMAGVENRTERQRRSHRGYLRASVWYWDAPKGEIFTQITRERMANRHNL